MIMAEEMSLLLHYLKRPNPKVDSTWSLKDGRTGSKVGAKDGPHDHQHLRNVLEWEGMEWKDLKPIFDPILNRHVSKLPSFEDSLDYPRHLKEISDENSLDALLIRWTYPVVSTALSIAQSQPESQGTYDTSDHPFEISMAKGGQAYISTEKRLTPDWAGILYDQNYNKRSHSNNTRHYRNVLPGDTKLSTKFKSEWGWRDQRFREPIIQVFTYCRRAHVPYGFIITQEELVVLHLFYGDEDDPNTLTEVAKKYEYLEWKAIPWANSTSNDLTINLTLWCLHMLAAKMKPIGGRGELKTQHEAAEASTRGSMAEPESGDISASDSFPVSDQIHYSFSKRRRSEERESESSRGTKKKRRAKR